MGPWTESSTESWTTQVVPVARLELAVEPRVWPFAQERRAEIDAHFAAAKRAKPALWNGRVLLMHSHQVDGDVFRGAYSETDFASFLAWRDWGFPDPAIWNSAGMAAVRSTDGAFLLGVMGAHTANAGRTYFPCGTPDPDDVKGSVLDLDASLRRELREETGLDADEFTAEAGWYTVFAGPRIVQIKVLQAPVGADVLQARADRFLAQETEPELAAVRMVRSPADLDPVAMPDFVIAFLMHVWA